MRQHFSLATHQSLPIILFSSYSDNQGSLEPSAAEQDPMRQHFSLATHQSLPIILFSSYSDNQGSLEPSAAEQDPMRQHFSLATHPSLPIILFSDGFLVTVVQLPVDVNSATMMRDLVLESARFLKKVYEQENLDMTVADAYKLAKGNGPFKLL